MELEPESAPEPGRQEVDSDSRLPWARHLAWRHSAPAAARFGSEQESGFAGSSQEQTWRRVRRECNQTKWRDGQQKQKPVPSTDARINTLTNMWREEQTVLCVPTRPLCDREYELTTVLDIAQGTYFCNNALEDGHLVRGARYTLRVIKRGANADIANH